jgi:alpha-ketoglutarate-dependent taurine dioxygenase
MMRQTQIDPHHAMPSRPMFIAPARFDDPAVSYRHQWHVGDVLVWDNIALQHGRRPFDPKEPRSLRRVQIDLDAAPEGA